MRMDTYKTLIKSPLIEIISMTETDANVFILGVN